MAGKTSTAFFTLVAMSVILCVFWKARKKEPATRGESGDGGHVDGSVGRPHDGHTIDSGDADGGDSGGGGGDGGGDGGGGD